MDSAETAKAYRRRADAREVERLRRFDELRDHARSMAGELRRALGPRIRVYLFGSLLDVDQFRGHSDIDLAVEGLTPSEYWEAGRRLETLSGKTGVDLVRMETASKGLRDAILAADEILT